jgi:hypothetical protein
MVDIVNARIFSSGGGNVGTTLNGRLKVDALITGGNESGNATALWQGILPLTLVDTEYPYALGDSTLGFEFKNRGNAVIRYSFTPGKVAGSLEPYYTLKSNWAYGSPEAIDLTGYTIYFATSTLGQVMEIIRWS